MSILAGKSCLITGASAGIGRALAFGLAHEGASLILTGRNEMALAQTCEEAKRLGAREVRGIVADLAQPDDLQNVCSDVQKGSVDVLINNAGVFPQGSFLELGLKDLDDCLAVNLTAPFALSRAVAEGMVARRWGRIVNIGSSSAYMGVAGSSVYCTSKHALLGFSRALHLEMRGFGVRVSCVSPGSVDTAMGKSVLGQNPATFLRAEEVAEAVIFSIKQDGNLVCDEIRLNRVNYQ